MKFSAFSEKQLKVLRWWCGGKGYDGIICDGAVRSGKTLCMSVSFVSWAMASFSGKSFAVCGKTIRSVKRNVILPLIDVLCGLGFEVCDRLSSNYMEVCGDMPESVM